MHSSEIKNAKGEPVEIREVEDLPAEAKRMLENLERSSGGLSLAERRKTRNVPKKHYGKFVASPTKANGNRAERRRLASYVRRGLIEIEFDQKNQVNLRALLGEGL